MIASIQVLMLPDYKHSYDLCIHINPSLMAEHRAILQSHFPKLN
jgi:hypothetical protein